jgi:hypothetical protein
MRNNVLLACILLISLLVRYLYGFYSPNFIIVPDSVDYWNFSQKILAPGGLSWIINPYRSPIYPIFLGVTRILFHTTTLEAAAPFIAIFQTIIGLCSLVLVYKISNNLLLTFLLGINPLLLAWERAVLTESLAIFWVLLFVYVCLQPKKNFVLLFFLSLIGYLLRPALIAIPLILVLVDYKKGSLTVLCYVITLLFFVFCNTIIHQYQGLSRSTDYNQMAQILNWNLPVTQSQKVSQYFARTVTDYRQKNGFPMVYRFLETYDPAIYTNNQKLSELSRFTRHVIRSNLPLYIVRLVQQIPAAVTDVSVTITSELKTTPKYANFFTVFMTLFRMFQFVLYGIGMMFTIIGIFQKHIPKRNLAIIGCLILLLLITTLVFSSGEYGRLLAPTLALVYIYDAMIVSALVRLWQKKDYP